MTIMNEWIIYLLTIIYTVISSYWNRRIIEKATIEGKQHIRHWMEDVFSQGPIFIAITLIYSLLNHISWLNAMFLGIHLLSLYWIIFDPLLNHLRLKNNSKLILIRQIGIWCYLSKGNKIDSFLLKYSCKWRYFLKLVVLIGSFILYKCLHLFSY